MYRTGGHRCNVRSAGDRSNHGAFSPEGNAYSCFICGKHSVRSIIAHFTSWKEAGDLIKEYSNELIYYGTIEKERATNVQWPPDCATQMPSIHAKYLHKRGYDPKLLRELYGVECCYQTGFMKYRIVIPVYQNGVIVTYVGRDVTNKAPLKYKNLPERNSVLPVKETIFNIDNVHEKAIICEGPFDAMRFGAHGVCTWGLQFTSRQTNILAKRLKHAFIMFDSDPTAQAKGRELGAILSFQGVTTDIVFIEEYKDPGELPQHIADDVKRELLQ
ncbi:MAG: hypothetical protein DRO67_00320 [Candidatus Asgardarchaeum californiense]|nr:MAG: hypothetical protein DRO67_00320 [Candidatus Asgardarchaeum californiense]